MRLINKVITVKTILFVYIILYGFATLIAPAASAAKYVAAVLHGDYTFPLTLIKISIAFAVFGLVRSATAIRLWVFLLPALFYCGVCLYAIPQSPNPSLTGMMNFLFIICLSISLTWEKSNG